MARAKTKGPRLHVGSCYLLWLVISSLNVAIAFTATSVLPVQQHSSINNRPASLLFAGTNGVDETDATREEEEELITPQRVVIIGGGWAGFTAADALSTARKGKVKVTLLDAAPRGTGGLAGGWRTSSGRPVESGIHGFWREYKNTFALMEHRIGLNLNDILTPFTPSILVSKNGQVAVAPVLKTDDDDDNDSDEDDARSSSPRGTVPPDPMNLIMNAASPMKLLADLLPPPLDLAVLAQLSPTSPVTPLDRISGIGLLGAWADFGPEDPISWERYDSISAEKLFKTYAGLTDSLYDEFVSPLLHVLPMTPGYDCSAAAALSCFHVFALQSKGAFDVKWCRGGIAERIFNPWVDKLTSSPATAEDEGNISNNDCKVEIRGGARVSSIQRVDETTKHTDHQKMKVILDSGEELQCDAVVLAVGGTAMGRLTATSPALQEISNSDQFDNLRGITCVAVRLFLKPDAVVTEHLKGGKYFSTQLPPCYATAMAQSPVIVCGADIGNNHIPELKETGFCIYDLQRMHDEFAAPNDVAVLEVDFFRADDIANLSNDAHVAEFTLTAVAAALGVPPIDASDVIDVAVVRARNAVSHFNVGSAACSPEKSKLGEGLYICGDWVDRSGHASWSTEKAVVTGKQAALAVSNDLGLNCDTSATKVIPAASDTPQLKALRTVAKTLRSVAPPPGEDSVPPSPWVFIKDTISGMSGRS
eukprot:scaffold55632_cov56-Attheya_sp.AAC.3